MIIRSTLLDLLDKILQPNQFQDYCPNGLQIEGASEIHKIVTGVSLNQALIDQAITKHARAIIVHHGIFWQKDSYVISGIKYQRIAKLIKHDINLFAYHLPLDNHPEFGNNVQLAKLLDISVAGQSGEQNLLWYGDLASPQTFDKFSETYQQKTGHRPLVFGDSNKLIHKVAWCTGAAQNMLEDAANLGVDCYITGEINEQTMALSLESGINFIAGGHYVTERYGMIALTKFLNSINLDAEFIEVYNPI